MHKDDVQRFGTVIAVVGLVGLVIRALFRGVVNGQGEFPGSWADAMTSFPNSAVIGWLIFGGAAIGGLIAYVASILEDAPAGGGITVWIAGGLVAIGLVPAAIAMVVSVVVWLVGVIIVILILGFIAAFLMAIRG